METYPDWKIPWVNLYNLYVGPYVDYDDERCFRAFAGVPIAVAETVYQRYHHQVRLSRRTDLLMLLNYLKDYPTEDNGRAQFKFKTRSTYREKISSLLEYLDYTMSEIYLDRRYFLISTYSSLFFHVFVVSPSFFISPPIQGIRLYIPFILTIQI
jgi:hypothetical protein